jgi:1-acyl-sn-glycerol-3-phosphate acyltransferase
MMVIIRSILFQIAFYISNIVFCTAIFWVPLVPHRLALATIETYMSYFGWLERVVVGLRYEIVGREHIPTSGCYIAAIKHQSVWETYKLHEWFKDPATIMKEELRHLPLWGWYAVKMRAIFVARGTHKAVQSLIAGGLRAKASGQPIVIFPQGTRVPYGAKKPYKRGVVELYTALDVPIIPIALNSGKFWPRQGFIVRPGVIQVRVLPPIPPGLEATEALARVQDAIETESAKL